MFGASSLINYKAKPNSSQGFYSLCYVVEESIFFLPTTSTHSASSPLVNPRTGFSRGGGNVTSIVTCVVLELVSLTPYCKEGILSLGSWISVE